MKPIRRDVILNIIKSKDIETQGQLLGELSERGIHTTQATLSRDIKDLKLIKERAPSGKLRYAVAKQVLEGNLDSKLRNIFKESVKSFDYAQNLLVIKTLPGLAPAACSALDSWEFDNLVGSLAGNDTAFLAMKDPDSAVALYNQLKELVGD